MWWCWPISARRSREKNDSAWFVSAPSLPKGWTKWKFWQYNNNAKIPGITVNVVDSDWFNGNLAELKYYAWNGSPPASDSPSAIWHGG